MADAWFVKFIALSVIRSPNETSSGVNGSELLPSFLRWLTVEGLQDIGLVRM